MSDPTSDQDARVMEGTQFNDRTRSTMEHGTRIADDRRTHLERVNGLGPGRFGDAEDTGEPVLTDQDAPRLPYRTIEPSIIDGAIRPPGTELWLQPHEVGPHHVPTERPMDLLTELENRVKALASHSEAMDGIRQAAEAAVGKMHDVVARLEAAAARLHEVVPAEPAPAEPAAPAMDHEAAPAQHEPADPA